MSVRPLTLPVLLLLLGVCLVRLIHQYCDCFTPLASWILFLVFSLVLTLVSYFVYVVIFCRSQFVPAPSVHVLFYFQIGLSLARVFLFSKFTLTYHSLLWLMIVLKLYHCPASDSLLVTLPHCPAMLFWLFYICSFWLVMYCVLFCYILPALSLFQHHSCVFYFISHWSQSCMCFFSSLLL